MSIFLEENASSQLNSHVASEITNILCILLGPNYWCASIANAQRCSRTVYKLSNNVKTPNGLYINFRMLIAVNMVELKGV